MSPSRTSLAIIFVTVFIDLLGFGIVLPLLPRYADAMNASWMMQGMLMASFSMMQFLFAPLWGRLSDRVGRRPLLLAGLIGSTFFYAMFGYVSLLDPEQVYLGLSPLQWLLVSRIGAGIAGATIPVAAAYIADVTTPENRSKGMALIGAAFGIGFTFGPLLAAFFVGSEQEASPVAAPGFLASSLSAIAFLVALFKLPESRTAGQDVPRHQFHLGQLVKVLTTPIYLSILAATFLTTFAFAHLETTLAMFTKDLKMSPKANFYVFAYIGFILALVQGGIVRRMSGKVSETLMALIGAVLMTLGLFATGLAASNLSTALLFASLPIAVSGFAALTPSLQSLLSRNAPSSEQGEILGYGQSASAIARILGPISAFALRSLNNNLPYLVGAALMLGGGLLILLIRPANQPSQSAS